MYIYSSLPVWLWCRVNKTDSTQSIHSRLYCANPLYQQPNWTGAVLYCNLIWAQLADSELTRNLTIPNFFAGLGLLKLMLHTQPTFLIVHCIVPDL